jgi:8-oxo-dGTP pyrophosphatase MutT (NUDIX family)
VLLIDAADRLLLFRWAAPRIADVGHFWLTPGGGVEEGEDLDHAAARELLEETGLAVAPSELRSVAYTTGYADLGWAAGLFRDDFFICCVQSHEVSTAGFLDYERRDYAGHHWWSQAELAATDETVYPFGLAALLADLLSGRMPETPVVLPWHH